MGKLCIIGSPESDDCEKRMNANSMVGFTSCSLDKECKRLYEDEIKINSVKLHSKSKKREENTKVKRRFYYLQDKDGVEIAGIKKEVIGFKKGNQY